MHLEAGPRVSHVLALDIGGSHVTAAVIDARTREIAPGTRTRADVDENADGDVILDTWAHAALASVRSAATEAVERVGIAMPAPFDYQHGVSLMQHKFRALYGRPVATLLQARLSHSPLVGAPIVIANDADLFALGEWWAGAAQGCARTIGLTLGTGLGAGFVAEGRIVTSGPQVPPGGELWDVAYLDGVAEDYVSARAITASYARQAGVSLAPPAIAERAESGEPAARETFLELAHHLARVLEPQVERFRPECVVLGGNIARAWPLFGPHVASALQPVACRPSVLFEDAALLGAAALAA